MKRKILIVEDNVGLSQMQKDWLAQAGYDAVTAMNEPIARSLIRRTQFDLILSDVRLPEGDGISLLEWLRKERKDIPFILTTEYVSVSDVVRTIKLGHGTGSTPTLMGFGQDKDKLVVITDGSKRMKLVAFWRDEIPSDAQQVAGYDKRIAGVHEVTCGLGTSTEWIQSEQSVVVGGYDAFVVNNINVTNQEINDKIIGVIAIGPIVKGPQGAECVRWNTKEKKWESKWTRSDVSSVSMIPAVSIKSEMVFVCGWNDASGWEVTGLDWKSGATRHRSILGKNNRANGAYAIIQYLANGDLLFNSVAGPIRVKY